jgi:phosphatidylglycerophosphatase A
MKTFIASGFGAGLLWRFLFGDRKGGGSFASLIFVVIVYFLQLETIWLLFLFINLIVIYIFSVDDKSASNDPSWITLDEIVGMSLASLASPSELLPLVTGFIIFRTSDILKSPKIVARMEEIPGKKGVLYDDLAAGAFGLLGATIVSQFMNLSL